MGGGVRWIPLALLIAGCAPHHLDGTLRPTVSWDFAARPTYGEVRVLPVVTDLEPQVLVRETFLGSDLPGFRLASRARRTQELEAVPGAVGLALPGAVHGELGPSWDGHFRVGAFPNGGRERILAALRGRVDLETALSDLARNVGGDASLFVWVDRLVGSPLSAEAFPGDIVRTEIGPVVVDHSDEPYRVTARVGMALVASDGEVVLRYRDAFEAVLSRRSDPLRVGRELARALAREVAPVWPCDPRLAEPGAG
jgi:hypothetical protein